jgi:Tfp pilus assembly protein PilF
MRHSLAAPVVPTSLLLAALMGCKGESSPSTGEPSAAPGAAPASASASPAAAPPAGKGKRADVKQDKKRSRAEQKAWSEAMAKGRARFRAKDFATAVEAFDAALKISPDDAQTLSELGWAAFQAGDLQRAEEMTRASLLRSSTAEVKGATLYNLGRIEEQRNVKDKAIDAYEQSLRVRPNATVLARLRSLDAARADAFAPLAFSRADGPHPDLAAFCAKARAGGKDGEKVLCDPEKSAFFAIEGPTEIASVSAPYQKIALHSTLVPVFMDTASDDIADAGPGTERLFLAVKLPSGVFLSPELGGVYNPGAFGIHQSLTVRRFELRDVVPGGAKEIVISYGVHADDMNLAGAEMYATESEHLMLCGVPDAGGLLKCTTTLLFSQHEWYETHPEYFAPGEVEFSSKPYDRSFALAFEFTPAGSVTFRNAKGPGTPMPLPAEVEALVGSRLFDLR